MNFCTFYIPFQRDLKGLIKLEFGVFIPSDLAQFLLLLIKSAD